MNLIIPSIIPRALCLSVDTALYERSAAQGRLVCNGFYFIIKKITRAVGRESRVNSRVRLIMEMPVYK